LPGLVPVEVRVHHRAFSHEGALSRSSKVVSSPDSTWSGFVLLGTVGDGMAGGGEVLTCTGCRVARTQHRGCRKQEQSGERDRSILVHGFKPFNLMISLLEPELSD
jgi:hypothetical protein